MANHYGIPCVMGGLSTDSKHLDVQSGFEKAMTAIPLLGKANVIFGPGVLNSGNTYSLEQLVIDADAIGALRKMNNPVDASEGRRACDLIKAIGPGHHYLEADHTMAHFRAYWRPGLFNRELTFGSQDARNDIAGRAQACIREHLESAEQEILDRKTADELEKMVKSALEDG
jgi:trimethylamine--corrinoid protein Co-methyltransferase